MVNNRNRTIPCAVCGKKFRPDDVLLLEVVRQPVFETIQKEHPDLTREAFICRPDLARYRAQYIEDALEEDKGELSVVEQEVLDSLKLHEIMSEDVNELYEGKLSLGDRLSDKIAEFGGSWYFIIAFFSFMMVWIGINALVLLWKPFDPYPFILLNLILSCLAAIQAPIIMMSQNRQEARDRLRSENDYRVNLKAELEIRHLHEKLDHLMMHQWARLLEIQRIQLQLMEEEIQKRKGRP